MCVCAVLGVVVVEDALAFHPFELVIEVGEAAEEVVGDAFFVHACGWVCVCGCVSGRLGRWMSDWSSYERQQYKNRNTHTHTHTHAHRHLPVGSRTSRTARVAVVRW